MERDDLLDQLRILTIPDRLDLIEAALRDVRLELTCPPRVDKDTPEWRERDRLLAAAAKAALPLYQADGELTAFTVLDGEPFIDYEAR